MEQARRTFGRAAAAQPASANNFHHLYEAPARPSEFPNRGTALLLASPLLLLFVESLFSGTEIITPLSSGWLWTMRSLGLVDGAVLWYFVRQSPTYEEKGLVKEILLWLAAPLFMLVTFNALAWRTADWIAFGNSHAQWERVQYPVKSVSHGRKGRRDTLDIDPYHTGEPADIAIPRAQYNELFGSTEGLCVTVQQRRAANGAIQIKNNGSYTWNEPWPAEISQCGTAY